MSPPHRGFGRCAVCHICSCAWRLRGWRVDLFGRLGRLALRQDLGCFFWGGEVVEKRSCEEFGDFFWEFDLIFGVLREINGLSIQEKNRILMQQLFISL